MIIRFVATYLLISALFYASAYYTFSFIMSVLPPYPKVTFQVVMLLALAIWKSIETINETYKVGPLDKRNVLLSVFWTLGAIWVLCIIINDFSLSL